MNKGFFSEKIVEWYEEHHRDLPWRNTQEPYKIWLSEIILQQTRVIQGLPYYQKFIRNYPTIKLLAAAPEREVLRLWQGLGYYTRARNLHKCAIEIVENMRGKFPQTFSELRNLPGIGDYTAAAIASFSFNERVAVVDGNVFRVLSRVFGIDKDIASPQGRKFFSDVANTLVSEDRPATYNQAIMEFGALQCIPKNPKCDDCVLKKGCYARLHRQQDLFPVKTKKKKSTKRHFFYFVIRKKGKILMNERVTKDIWKGLYDFPLVEAKKIKEAMKVASEIFPEITQKVISKEYQHILTHRIIHAHFIRIDLQAGTPIPENIFVKNAHWYSPKKIADLPKPVLISHYLRDEFIL